MSKAFKLAKYGRVHIEEVNLLPSRVKLLSHQFLFCGFELITFMQKPIEFWNDSFAQ